MNKKNTFFPILFILIWATSSLYSQRIDVKQDHDPFLPTEEISVKNDSVKIEIIDKRNKKKIDSILYRIVGEKIGTEIKRQIQSSSASPNPIEDNLKDNVSAFKPFEGKTIRNISIDKKEPFDTSNHSKLYSVLSHLGNKTHVNTFDYVIKNNLLFEVGDTLSPQLLEDNERLLRNLPYIKDVYFIIIEYPRDRDAVDVLVVSQDLHPLAGSFILSTPKIGTADIYNKNLFGTGYELKYQLSWDLNQEHQKWGHEFNYKINNIGRTFLNFSGSYENYWDIEAHRFTVNRTFFTPEIKYAGGVGFDHITRIPVYDSIIKYNVYDIWMGRSFLVSKSNSKYKVRDNITTSMRINTVDFLKQPNNVSADSMHFFQQRTTVLFSVDYSQQGFLKTSLVNEYGKTEDLPYGRQVTLTGGIELNQFGNYPYIDIHLKNGKYFHKVGYVYTGFVFSSYFTGSLKRGAFEINTRYFTPLLFDKSSYKLRTFIDLKYKAGINRNIDEFLKISNRNGVRGIGTDIKGREKLYVNFETNWYSSHYFMGFRFVYFVFSDFGIIDHNKANLFDNPLYSSIGGGIRIKNENLVFNSILIRLAYYPIIANKANPEYLLLSSRNRSGFNKFSPHRPSIYDYIE